jgi:hypothetical protein
MVALEQTIIWNMKINLSIIKYLAMAVLYKLKVGLFGIGLDAYWE